MGGAEKDDIQHFNRSDPVHINPREENKMANGLLVSVYDAGGNLVTVKRFEEFWDIKPIIDAAFTLNCQVLIEQDGPEEEPEEEDTILSHLIEQELVK